MLREFALSTKEGLALMVLAEALLRVPDARTADQFIEDKLGQGDFVHHETRSSAFLVNASAWALGMSARVIQPGETPQGTIGRLTKRLGVPAVRAATRQAMRLMGSHFVLGETIEAALERAHSADATRYSFDMLGEGARTAADAERYFNSYASAIDAIGRAADNRPLPDRPGISVKLSALHPRFEAVSRQRVMSELVPRLIDLARRARAFDLNFTVDAEEADRLELSLDVIAAAFRDASFKGWDGFGLAIQAYQKRAQAVIGYSRRPGARAEPADDAAPGQGRLLGHRDQARAGARPRRLSGVHPQGDDRSELRRLRAAVAGAAAPHLPAIRHPQRADGGDRSRTCAMATGGFEFQRLHGMGEALYAQLREDRPDLACRTYAPVGSHRDLLAYLVRRLLENGANSSFVAVAADDSGAGGNAAAAPGRYHRHRRPTRGIRTSACRAISISRSALNSRGIEFGERAALSELVAAVAAEAHAGGGTASPTRRRPSANAAIAAARDGFRSWSRTPAHRRAAMLERAADLLEQRHAHFIALLQREGGKTLDDALSEVREAVDFCRYYAAEGRQLFGEDEAAAGTDRREQCAARCAAAASSSRSRRGIFRWRSFWARWRRR